ncbi:dihydrolipoamide dehydrogenase [Deinococcus detaillensis]|uniref:Dihydrolipoamide dehydrogenase n=1 Tax=Deinococcus detaillensis TaxID=2592048 RepID=A0A553V4R4_9DEIO|nr:FAD-dependent oxidoreductase [Deinococcus detaillensis]TSA87478.1 dihydrolipoamide dehydrogenase [Deinococcus detaillensis]
MNRTPKYTHPQLNTPDYSWAEPKESGHSPLKADVAVIGGGAGGLTAALMAAVTKKRVLLIERGLTGGECTFTGCVPSKALLSIAKTVHAARQSAALGLAVTGEADWAKVQAEVRRVINSFEDVDSPASIERRGVQVVAGEAKFVSPHVLEVQTSTGTRTVMAEKFVVATGSEVMVPDLEGLSDVPYLTHQTIFDVAELPRHLLILGGGPIGCELSQAFVRLGSRVTTLQRGERLIDKDEPEASQALLDVLRRDGVTVHLGVDVVRAEALPSGVRLHLKDGRHIDGSHLLLAVGKKPRVENLGLEVVGAAYDEKGLKVKADMQSVSCPYVWGAGDVVGGPMFTHGATERGTLAGLGSLAWWGRAAATFRAPAARVEDIPWVTYTEPEIAHWGLTEAQAVKQYGRRVQVVDYDFSHLDRAATERESGFVKLVALSGLLGSPLGLTVVGAQVVGSCAGELIQLLSLPSRLGFHPVRLALLPVSYPTYAEAVRQSYLGLFTSGPTFGKRRAGRAEQGSIREAPQPPASAQGARA